VPRVRAWRIRDRHKAAPSLRKQPAPPTRGRNLVAAIFPRVAGNLRAMRFVRGLRRAFAARMAPGMSETLNRPRNPCNDCGTALDPDRYIVFRVNPDEMWTNGRADISLCRRCWADRKDGRPYERTKGAISET